MSRGDRAQEIELETPRGRLAGLRWARDGAPRALCLHGWLDNAASFEPLAPLLDRLELVAIDLPGHGRSAHRPAACRYHFIDYLWDVEAMLDALGWADAHLIGHSMGGGIGAVYAAGAPGRCRSLTLLDAPGPLSSQAADTTGRLRRSLASNRRGTGTPRAYASIEVMVSARRQVSELSENSARRICERAARRHADGVTWRSDPALNWISPLIMSDGQALNLMAHIEAPVLSFVTARASPWLSAEQQEARNRVIPRGRHETVDGHHHFHMDEPALIAGRIQEFVLGNDHPGANTQQQEPAA
ncbi:MAG: alpha/beta hydrolase [Xanthomonadales bacterium]|nr:alpha/beta hydrolase [Xanthomonadales bacterium]